MKLGLSTCAGLLALIAGCSAASSETLDVSGDAVEVSVVPASVLAEVRRETGREGGSARPLFEPESEEPAFYEVQLNPGWAVVTAASEAPHVVEWALGGRSPTERLDLGTRAAMKRVYRLDAAVYVAADASGNAIGRSTKSLVKIDRSGEVPQLVEVSSDEALRSWRSERARLVAGGGVRTQADGPLLGSLPPAKTCAVKGEVPSYEQLDPGEGPNTTACASGCGPTAWAMILGWADRRAQAHRAEDAAFAGIFDAPAPLTMAPEIGELSMELGRLMRTMCVADQGATMPWSMAEVKTWLAPRAPDVTVEQRYNFLMTPDPAIRDATVDVICDGRPAIIGIGTLFGGDGHYPVAKGYDNGKFEVDMGWGGDGNGWYDATTWYVGSIRHQRGSASPQGTRGWNCADWRLTIWDSIHLVTSG